jgi:cbb3-type cytochrome oxidase subunit 3
MGRLLLLILSGTVVYSYLKQRKEFFDKAEKFNKDAVELRRKREEEAGAKEA